MAMPEDLCPACHRWRYLPGDRYCGWCGASLLRAEASIEPAFVYADQSVDEIGLVLANGGSCSLEGSEVVLRSLTAATEMPIAVIPQGELRARDGSRYRLPLRTAELAPDGGIHRWEVRHRGEPGQGHGRCLGSIHLNLPPPDVACVEPLMTLHVDDPTQPVAVETELALRLLSHADGAEVRAIRCEGRAERMPTPALEAGAVPFALARGKDHPLRLTVSAELCRVLINQPQGIDFQLVLAFTDRDREDAVRPVTVGFRLHVPTPARPLLSLRREQFVGMIGGRLRVQAEVHNRGGAPCRLHETELRLTRGTQTLRALSVRTPGRAQPLQPGDKRLLEIGVPLDDLGLDDEPAQGTGDILLALTWVQRFDDDLPEQRADAKVRLRPRHPFRGIVAVDFGTTATAVAVLSDRQDVPELVTLGEHADYLPTAIHYDLNDDGKLCWVIGEQALRRAAEPGADLRYFFDNIKLHLKSPEQQLLPDGSARGWAGIAADYLTALRARLEGDSEVAAEIRAVYPTHPANFSPLATNALLRAYREAGMEPRSYSPPSGAGVVMSESWPQVLLELPPPTLNALRRLAYGKEGSPSDEPRRFALMSFDVGGGTTDLSLFDIEIRGVADISVREVATDTDFEFAGNAFSDLIARGLVAACDQLLLDRGLGKTADAAPFVLPWEDRAAVTAEELANGRAFADMARRLQHSTGALSGLRERIEAVVGPGSHWTTVMPAADSGEKTWDLVCSAWAEAGAAMARSWPLPEPPPTLHLRLQRGGELEIPWGMPETTDDRAPSGLFLDLGAFYRSFVTGMVDGLRRRITPMFTYAAEQDLELFVVFSGRGSLFPPVAQIPMELIQDYNLKGVQFRQVGTGFLKHIVAYGTGQLGRITRFGHGIAFQPLISARLCALAGMDRKTGAERLVAIGNGMPQRGQGRCHSSHPIPFGAGRDLRIVDLWLSPVFDGTLERQRDEHIECFQAEVTLSEADAAQTYVAVEAIEPDCLVVWLTWPGGSRGDAPADDWQWLELGRWSESPRGCVSPDPAGADPAGDEAPPADAAGDDRAAGPADPGPPRGGLAGG
jgi:hypothetical protein